MGKRKTSPTRHIFHKSIEIYYTQHMQRPLSAPPPSRLPQLVYLQKYLYIVSIMLTLSPRPWGVLLLLYNNLQSILRFASPAICISRKVSS